ncbi:hypothetical protein BH09BAC5_BH09BAC5_00240 [soil metagenome]
MKKLFTLAIMFFSVSMFAQSVSIGTNTTTTTTTTNGTKADALCKTWNLSMTENFGDQHKPTDVQKNDIFMLMQGGRYRLIMDGAAEGGTWTLSKDNLWITLTSDAGAIKKFKVIESSDSSLKVDYRDADDIHNIIYYSAAK